MNDSRTRRPGAVQHDLHLVQLFSHQPQRVQQRRRHHNGGAVLVVVEYGDVQPFLQHPLDLKAFRAADVLQIYPAEARGNQFHCPDHLSRVLGVQADGESVHPAKLFEQDRLALHHRQGRLGPDVAQPQHRRAVGHHGHQIALGGVIVHSALALVDAPAGFRHARRIRGGKVVPAFYRHLAFHLQLALVRGMQFQRRLVIIHSHSFPLSRKGLACSL